MLASAPLQKPCSFARDCVRHQGLHGRLSDRPAEYGQRHHGIDHPAARHDAVEHGHDDADREPHEHDRASLA